MMKELKYTVTLTGYEHRQLLRGLMEARNARIREGKPAEPLDELLIKVQAAPAKQGRIYAR